MEDPLNPMDDLSKDLSRSLPSPRDDEPASLRQDILDELRDHLQCAVRREQLRGAADERTAWQRVLARFGNPREIARKLYWQALWSRIVQQRILIAGGAGFLAVGVAVVGLLYVMMDRQQQLVSRQHEWEQRQQAWVDQQQVWALKQQANFELMLAKMNTPTPIYGTLKVQVDRPIKVQLSGGSLKSPISLDTYFREAAWNGSNAPQTYDFGDMTPGYYDLVIHGNGWRNDRKVLVRLGAPHLEEVVVPPSPLEAAELDVTTNLPEDWNGGLISVMISWKGVTLAGREWNAESKSALTNAESKNALTSERTANSFETLSVITQGNSFHIKLGRTGRGSLFFHNGKQFNSPDRPKPIALDLQPGQNTCHVDFPQSWIAEAETEPETAMGEPDEPAKPADATNANKEE